MEGANPLAQTLVMHVRARVIERDYAEDSKRWIKKETWRWSQKGPGDNFSPD